MSQLSCPQCPASQVVDPPAVIYTDTFHPQIVNVIHPIEIVNRHHCVPIPQHFYTCTVKDVFCPAPGTLQVAQISGLSKKKRKKR